MKYCFSIVSWLRGFAKSGPKNGSCGGSAAQDVDKFCATPARESDSEVKIVENWHAGSTFGSQASQNLHYFDEPVGCELKMNYYKWLRGFNFTLGF